ncbi:MAG: M28 family peptidase [Clostridia bacterium]
MELDKKYNKLIHFFKEISKVPRNSKKEEKIAAYLCEFAQKRNLWYRVDESNNVIIKKKASKGYEDKKTILFQAHTDMVCEKTKDSTHNFNSDPIEIIETTKILTAKDTTLGADDGIGVAYLLLLLDDEDIPHPNIECLFTTQEEIGMYGARDFNYSDIEASYLINLDGEEENTAIVGCAGGVSVHYIKELKLENESKEVYKLIISGLFGGHSGVDIDKNRINSNYLASKILINIEDVRLISFIGGNKDNAIANNTEVIFSTKEKNIDLCLNKALEDIELTDADKNLKVDIESIDYEGESISLEESKKLYL